MPELCYSFRVVNYNSVELRIIFKLSIPFSIQIKSFLLLLLSPGGLLEMLNFALITLLTFLKFLRTAHAL